MRLSGTLALLVLGTALAATPPAPAAPDSVTVPEVVTEAGAFSMVAATWRGSGTPDLQVRTRSTDGWSGWRHLHPLTDGPSGAEASRVSGTELLWVGPSSAAQVRVEGRVPGLDLVLIDPGTRPRDDAAPSYDARRVAATEQAGEEKRAPQPALRTRRDWGADNSLRNGYPRFSGELKQVHVHHTATGNGYARADVPALIRGMYSYHTQTLGWFDLGYNFLVDRFGRAWVGRSGGSGRLVKGAHTLGFNHKSVGIAVIGSHDTGGASEKAVRMVARLAAWKLDQAKRRATGQVAVTSQGSDRYAAGRRVRLPVIDGHRDTNDTACPGGKLYRRLPEIRKVAQRRIDRFS